MYSFFKGNDGEVFSYDEDQIALGLASDKTPMTPEEIDAHINPTVTIEQQTEMFKFAIQKHMDDAARATGYDDIKTAVTYADEPSVPKFQNEGRAFRSWRSQCWSYGYQEMDKVLGGTRPMPTVEQMISELPALVLP